MKSDEFPLLSIIVPVYNEKRTVDEALNRILSAPYAKQVIVVDDGSTDGSTFLVKRWRGHPEIHLLHHSANRGKGVAIRTGLAHARGQLTIIQDADWEYDPPIPGWWNRF
jgi:glycosyltransferase involved in cell wall biosynthesis